MSGNIYIYFPKSDPLKGTAMGDEVKGLNAIEILSVSNGVSMPLSGASAAGQARHQGRAMFSDVTITKYIDETTPYFNQFCAGGNIIPTAVISHFIAKQMAAKSEPILSYEITLSDVIISSVSYSGSHGDLPIENIALNYAKIKWVKREMDNMAGSKAPGGIPTTWDLYKNTP